MAESPKAISVFVLLLALMGVFALVLGMGAGTYWSDRIARDARLEASAGTLDEAGLQAKMEDSARVRRAGWVAAAFGLILLVAGVAGYVVCRHKERQIE